MEELLAGAGMSGFLAILDTPVPTPHLQELIDEVHALPRLRPEPPPALDLSSSVASVVLKLEALKKVIEATAKGRLR